MTASIDSTSEAVSDSNAERDKDADMLAVDDGRGEPERESDAETDAPDSERAGL